MIKLKFSLDKLNLNKETVLDLSKDQMNGVTGGVTEATDLTCQSLQTPTCQTLSVICNNINLDIDKSVFKGTMM